MPPDPRYTDSGDLIRPTDFHSSWVFVGSNIGLAYSPEAMGQTPAEAARNSQEDDFHNVYMKPEDYEYYLTNRTFAERTVLIMDKYVAQQKEPQDVVIRGSFDGLPHGMEVAVKNNKRPDGSTTDWAYYSFEVAEPGGEMPEFAKAHPDSECYDCHLAHGDFDNVWVQFYPVIRGVNPPPRAQAFAHPFKCPFLKGKGTKRPAERALRRRVTRHFFLVDLAGGHMGGIAVLTKGTR
jgi:hypothetical protein